MPIVLVLTLEPTCLCCKGMRAIPGLLSRDGWLLFAMRGLRMFAYGALSVVLILYLSSQGLAKERIGLLLTMTLLGDIAISLWITTAADRLGRKRMLILGALLMALVGAVFAGTASFPLLIVVATIGVLSPSDKEVGPFLAIEQAALSHETAEEKRTAVFAWYQLVGSVAAAVGTLVAGFVCEGLQASGSSGSEIYRPIVLGYAGIGIVLASGFAWLSPAAEPTLTKHPPDSPRWLGLHKSRGVVLRLAALFALDAFGGGFILQSIVAYWFHTRYGLEPGALGSLLFVANLLAAASALVASSLARRFGLIRTMVFTHLPSNVLLMLIPLMPNLPWAIALLLVRYSISQMDVPTRQSYTMAIVAPDERSAAAGITTLARSLGAALSPLIAGYLLADERWISVPFFLAGGVKIVYDVWLYQAFMEKRMNAEG